jgi:hypothetical protein
MIQANIVLAAITELLKEKGMDSRVETVNPTHYFGTLMVTLEQSSSHPVETIGATLYLLSVLLPQLDGKVLKARAELVAGILIACLDKHASDSSVSKHVLECATALALALADLPPNNTSARLLQVLLVYSLDHRPRIRRAGQEGVRAVLEAIFNNHQSGSVPYAASSTPPSIGLPKQINETVVGFCLREISQCTPKDPQIVLFLCGLLQSTIHFLSISSSGKILEALLTMVGKGNSILVVQAMRTVDAFFLRAAEVHLTGDVLPHTPEAKAREKFLVMSGELLGALLQLKPHQNDQLASAAYLHTLKTGLVSFTSALENTSSSSSSLSSSSHSILLSAYARVPSLLSLIGEGLGSGKKEVMKQSQKAMADILSKVVTGKFVEQSRMQAEAAASSRGNIDPPPFYKVLEYVEGLVNYKFKPIWTHVLPLISCFLRCSQGQPSDVKAMLFPLLKTLDSLRREAQGEVFGEDPELDYRAALDEALGTAIEVMGPETILTVLPLMLPTDFYTEKKQGKALGERLEESRAWLLPLFRSYISASSASLSFFLSFFLPLSSLLHTLEKQAAQQVNALERKAWGDLKGAVWDILPPLCAVLPSDLPSSYKLLLKSVWDILLQDEFAFMQERMCKAISAVVRRLKARAEGEKGKEEGEEENEAADAASDDDADAVFSDSDDEAADSDEDEDAAVARAKVKREVRKAERRNERQRKMEKQQAFSAAEYSRTNSAAEEKFQNFTPAQAREILEQVVAPQAKRLLPLLFTLAAMPQSPKPIVLECVNQTASISSSLLLNDSFKLVLRKLLEHGEQAKERRGVKEMEEGEGVSNKPNNQASQDLQRSHLLTDLIYSLCLDSMEKLSQENQAYLYQIVKNTIGSSGEDGEEDPALQKKMYKLLFLLISQPSFLTQKWTELIADLNEAAVTMQPAAMKARLQCLRIVLLQIPSLMLRDKSAVALLPSFLGEFILATKESAVKTRELAFEGMVEMGKKMLAVQDTLLSSSSSPSSALFGGLSRSSDQNPMLSEYIFMIAGGLAGGSPHMQSASTMCLARVMYEFKQHLSPSVIKELLHTILPLFESSKSRELIKSLLAFIKVCLLTFPLDVLEEEAPSIVKGLVLWSSEKKQRFKLKIKLLFEILMKKLGSETVKEMVPQEHTALLEHIRKMKEREKRHRAEAWQAKKGAKGEEEEEAGKARGLQDYDTIMKEEANVDDMTDIPAASSKAPRKNAKDANAVWLRDSNVDFLDSSVVGKVSATNPSLERKVVGGGATGYGGGVTRDSATGKMRVGEEKEDAEEGGGGLEGQKRRANAMIDLDELNEDLKQKKREKRKRNEEEDEDDGAQTQKKQQLPGAQFRSTKAGGDMKRKGQMQPYAFVALDPAAMNKRKKFTAQRRLESIVTAAKTGSQSGSAIAKGNARSYKKQSHSNKKH